jgi:hypothetical protein
MSLDPAFLRGVQRYCGAYKNPKRRYPTKADAQRSLGKLYATAKRQRSQMPEPFHCATCGAWHNGRRR